MKRLVTALWAAVFLAATSAHAQQASYVQIEAQPSLTRAQERVRDYAAFLSGVSGFALASGWYAIVLGPFDRAEAEAELRALRFQGRIPQDSFIAEPANFRRQFWPIGASRTTPGVGGTDDIATTTLDPFGAGPAEDDPFETMDTGPAVSEETPREAAASERRLDLAERQQLQVALKWAGHYDAAIDGSFGRGTRNSMASWQRANGYEATGILTTRQRSDLMRQYDAILDGMDLRRVTETRAGVSIVIPTGVVAFDKYKSPFVHYAATGDVGARVLLISRPGDETALGGLYEIMQTLEIVPREGPRSRQRGSFTLSGANDRIVSHTEARLQDGQIKGFTLVWPAGDEARRTRVLAAMQASFEPVPGVLPLSATADTEPAIDLLAGLQVRRPLVTASGFYVDSSGTVVTTREAVAECGRITLDDQYEARVLVEDPETGVALLRAREQLAPRSVAALRTDMPRLRSEVAVSGFSFGGVLSAPTLTFGTLEDLRGLDGSDNVKRLALASLPGDAGGPVLDAGGAVLGMLLPREDGNRQLPEDVSFAVKASDIEAILGRAGLRATPSRGRVELAPEDLTDAAVAMTVLVSCWE